MMNLKIKNSFNFSLLVVLFTFINTISAQSKVEQTKAYKWLDIALEVTANDVDRVGAKPTIQSMMI